MTQAAIGLIGVVVGGVITAFVQQLRPNARRVRAAARLLLEELTAALTYGEGLLKSRSDSTRDRTPSNALWLEQRGLLAAELGRPDWTALTDAYRAVEEIESASERTNEFSPVEREILESAVQAVREGRDVLDALSGSLPTITQTLRRRGIRRAR
jgi:hypothetical protein